MKQWFPTAATNNKRAGAGSAEGLAGRAYPVLVAQRLNKDCDFRSLVCRLIGRNDREFDCACAGEQVNQKVVSVIDGEITNAKPTLRIRWKNGGCTNFIVKKSGPAQVCLKRVETFIPEFEAQFGTKIPHVVQEALMLFVGRHPRQKDILDSIPVNYVGDTIRDLERAYRNRLTLASMYGYNEKMADQLLHWFRCNTANLIAYCFSVGAAKRKEDAAEYLWYHAQNDAQSDIELIDLNHLISHVQKLTLEQLAPMVFPRDPARIGSTINLPFGNLQYHEDALQFRHDRTMIKGLLSLKVVRSARKHFGSAPKENGHENELMIAKALNSDKVFREHFCDRVCRNPIEFVSAEAGGKHSKQEESVLGGKTPGKTDVSVLWKDGTRTNISVKMRAAGQVYLVTAKNFVDVYEAQYHCTVPSKVRRALAFFTGADPESRSILDATDISVDGVKAREIAYEQHFRLMFNVISNYDPVMADKLIEFLRSKIDNVFELCFAAGAVKDKCLWSDVLWYKNLVDVQGMGLDYLIPIPVVKAALVRNQKNNIVEPGPKNAGSTIQLPFGHVQYFHRQLEFYQKLKKIQSLLVS